jgi:hypothetical protein
MTSFKDFDPGSVVNRGLSGAGQTDMVICMTTGSLLLGLMGARAIATGLTALGIASEELFRGDRLPTLPLTDNAPAPESPDP